MANYNGWTGREWKIMLFLSAEENYLNTKNVS